MAIIPSTLFFTATSLIARDLSDRKLYTLQCFETIAIQTSSEACDDPVVRWLLLQILPKGVDG